MQRREFITLLGGAAAWPVASLAQEVTKIRRIGFLRVGQPPPAFIENLRQGLRDLGGKRSQMVTESLPRVCRIPVLVRDTSPTTNQDVEEPRGGAKNLSIELFILTESNPTDFGAILVAAQGSRALVVADHAEFTA